MAKKKTTEKKKTGRKSHKEAMKSASSKSEETLKENNESAESTPSKETLKENNEEKPSAASTVTTKDVSEALKLDPKQVGEAVVDLTKPNEASKLAAEVMGLDVPLPEANHEDEDEDLEDQDEETFRLATAAALDATGLHSPTNEQLKAMNNRRDFVEVHPRFRRKDEPAFKDYDPSSPGSKTLAKQPEIRVAPMEPRRELVERPWFDLTDTPLKLSYLLRAAAAQGYADNLETREHEGVVSFRAKPHAVDMPLDEIIRHACAIQKIKPPSEVEEELEEPEKPVHTNKDGVKSWDNYEGVVYRDGGLTLLAFENVTKNRHLVSVPHGGSCFGFVATGQVSIKSEHFPQRKVFAREVFILPNGGVIELKEANTRFMIVIVEGFLTTGMVGGPLPAIGTIEVDDGITARVLTPKQKHLEPALYQAHFEPGVTTEHVSQNQPTVYMVARGVGLMEHDGEHIGLKIGTVVVVPPKASVRTESAKDSLLDLVSFNPAEIVSD